MHIRIFAPESPVLLCNARQAYTRILQYVIACLMSFGLPERVTLPETIRTKWLSVKKNHVFRRKLKHYCHHLLSATRQLINAHYKQLRLYIGILCRLHKRSTYGPNSIIRSEHDYVTYCVIYCSIYLALFGTWLSTVKWQNFVLWYLYPLWTF